MGFRVYPALPCMECGETARLVAVCEKPDSETEARFYECSNPACRCAFKSCAPSMVSRGWMGLWEEEAGPKTPH
jgi:hypothetical protein